MGLSKHLIHSKPCRQPTKEEQKEIDLAWEIFCKTGSVCITNPLDTEEDNTIERLKQNPHDFFRTHCDYNGELPFDEFYERLLAGEYDEK